jgi:hypothetical protein
MTRDEALAHFQKNYVEPQIEQSLADLDAYYQDNWEELTGTLKDAFRQLCQETVRMQSVGKKNSIAYIYGSFLYSSLCLGQSVYRLDAYDENWFLDRAECAVFYDAGWAFSFLHDACSRLAQESKKYVGKITRYDIELIKRTEAGRYSEYIEDLGREVMEDVFLAPEFLALEKENELTVFMGEYKDLCQKIGIYHK